MAEGDKSTGEKVPGNLDVGKGEGGERKKIKYCNTPEYKYHLDPVPYSKMFQILTSDSHKIST